MDINYEEIKGIVKNNLLEVMEENYNFFKDYNIEVELEQHFLKNTKVNPKTIYIVIRFGQASVSFGQTVLPVSIIALTEENKINICQKLFMDFSHKFNLKKNEDSTIQQIYESPEVTTNFEYLFAGIRSLVMVSGLFVLSKNANFFTYYYLKDGGFQTNIQNVYATYDNMTDFLLVEVNIVDEKKFLLETQNNKGTFKINFSRDEDGYEKYNVDGYEIFDSKPTFENKYGINLEIFAQPNESYSGSFEIVVDYLEEEIPTLQQTFNGSTQLETLGFYNTNNFTTSIGKIGTKTISFSTYLLDNISVINDALDVYLEDLENVPEGIEKRFKIKILFKNGKKIIKEYRLVSIGATQMIGDIPTINMTFTQ